jgi:hypothetical protein
MTKRHRHSILWLGIGLLVGILIIVTVRFFTIKDNHVHYHANFGLFINGKRDEFKSFTYYEEVSSCGGNDLMNPKIRTHLHDNKNSVVHVHDSAATWGHFFANLGYTLGNTLVKTDDGIYIDGQDGKKLTFWLNGQPVSSVANKTIGDLDVLLVSYGDENTKDLRKQNDQIKKDAKTYDETADPSACSGSKPLTFWDKLQQSVWSAPQTH